MQYYCPASPAGPAPWPPWNGFRIQLSHKSTHGSLKYQHIDGKADLWEDALKRWNQGTDFMALKTLITTYLRAWCFGIYGNGMPIFSVHKLGDKCQPIWWIWVVSSILIYRQFIFQCLPVLSSLSALWIALRICYFFNIRASWTTSLVSLWCHIMARQPHN